MRRQQVPRPEAASPVAGASADFESIFRTQFAYLWNTLRRLGIHSSDLEDVTLDLLCRVHRDLPNYDPARPLRPWLFGFAFRLASDYRRLARHRLELCGLDIDGADPTPDVLERLVSAEDRTLIEAALSRVSLDRRAVLMLHEIDGCSAPAIAAALMVPVNTVYSRLRLGRAELAQAVHAIERERGSHGER
jgi:RNA polymerase sigma-70 factor (ECF subfamily)